MADLDDVTVPSPSLCPIWKKGSISGLIMTLLLEMDQLKPRWIPVYVFIHVVVGTLSFRLLDNRLFRHYQVQVKVSTHVKVFDHLYFDTPLIAHKYHLTTTSAFLNCSKKKKSDPGSW
jgi:hypothetical protein